MYPTITGVAYKREIETRRKMQLKNAVEWKRKEGRKLKLMPFWHLMTSSAGCQVFCPESLPWYLYQWCCSSPCCCRQLAVGLLSGESLHSNDGEKSSKIFFVFFSLFFLSPNSLSPFFFLSLQDRWHKSSVVLVDYPVQIDLSVCLSVCGSCFLRHFFSLSL